jgi:phosphatidylglycerophosphate synthase
MGAGIAAGAAFAATPLPGWRCIGFLAAALLIQMRLLANMLDGMVAVRRGTASPWGELYNEVPDRVSDVAILVGAGYTAGSVPELGYLAACVALFVAYVRAQGKAVGGPQEFCGPMAKQHRMFVLTVAALASALLPAGWRLVGTSTAPELPAAALAVVIAGGVVTAWRRLHRVARSLGRKTP